MGQSVQTKKNVTCVVCRQGQMKRGKTTVTLNRGRTTVVFKNVPAYICDTCGDYEVHEAVADKLLKRAEAAVKNGAEVEILQYAA